MRKSVEGKGDYRHTFLNWKNKLIARPKELHHHIQANQTTVFLFFFGIFLFSYFFPPDRDWYVGCRGYRLSVRLSSSIQMLTLSRVDHVHMMDISLWKFPQQFRTAHKNLDVICAPAPYWYYHLFVCFVIIVRGYNNRRRLILDSSRAHPTSTVGFFSPPNDLK